MVGEGGPYTIELKDAGGCLDCASATFTVTLPLPTVGLSPSSVAVGGTVTVSGSNFNPSDTSCVISSTRPGWSHRPHVPYRVEL